MSRLPDGVVNRVLQYLDANKPVNEIIERFKVSRATVFRIRLSYDVFGTPYPPKPVKLGRPKALLLAEELVMDDIIWC